MTPRLFGMEIEFGMAVIGQHLDSRPQERLQQEGLHALMSLAHEQLACLPDTSGSGLFTSNGSRHYLDCMHVEIAGPEVDHPTDACRYMLANEEILAELANQVRCPSAPAARVMVFKGNVDYSQRGCTYGCHESYLHRCADPNILPRQLIPHLVSRVIFASGGLDPGCSGIRFSCFPRAHFFTTPISEASTSERGIYNTRHESLAAEPYRRCHVICGDSTTTPLAMWLKLATTALIVALAEAKFDLGNAVYPKDPVAALHALALDPTFRTTVPLSTGGAATALDIQGHYLRFVETHLDHSILPLWAPEACRLWREVLTRAAQGPAALARSLDFAIKYALFNNHIRRRGFDPDSLAHFNRALATLEAYGTKNGHRNAITAGTLDAALAGPLQDAVPSIQAVLHRHGLRLDLLDAFLALRAELCELDARFSQLTPTPGICSTLAPHLEPVIPGLDRISIARTEPPASTRAELRGRYVRRYAGRSGYSAEWTGIHNDKGRQLDLSDPFARKARWRRSEPAPDKMFQIDDLFRLGRYRDVLDRLPREGMSSDPGNDIETVILANARLGRRRDALRALRFYLRTADAFNYIAISLCAFAAMGLTPAVDEMLPLIAQGDQLLARGQPGRTDDYHIMLFVQNKGRALAFMGQLDEAAVVLRNATAGCQCRPRNLSRTQLYLAEVLRLQGDIAGATQLMETATATYRASNLVGDLADHAMLACAKLADDDRVARQALDDAAHIQEEHGCLLGLARTLCVKARRLKLTDDLPRIRDLCNRVDSLQTCPTARKILTRFDQWVNPEQQAGDSVGRRDYWGL